MKKITNKLLILFLLLIESDVFAEEIADPFSGGDPGVIAPINDYIIPMVLGVVVFSYRILIVKKGSNNKQFHNSAMN